MNMDIKQNNIDNPESMEQREIAPRIDFKDLFYQRLESIPEIPESVRVAESKGFQELGINKIKRRGFSIVFLDKEPYWDENQEKFNVNFNIWISDPDKIKNHMYPHSDVVDEFSEFLTSQGDSNITRAGLSSFILQDEQDRVYLIFEEDTAEHSARAISRGSVRMNWVRLLEKYDLKKIIGNFGGVWTDDKYSSRIVNLLGADNSIRQDEYLYGIAKKYEMNNFQFLRFRLLVNSAQEAKQSINVDSIAQEVLKLDKN